MIFRMGLRGVEGLVAKLVYVVPVSVQLVDESLCPLIEHRGILVTHFLITLPWPLE